MRQNRPVSGAHSEIAAIIILQWCKHLLAASSQAARAHTIGGAAVIFSANMSNIPR